MFLSFGLVPIRNSPEHLGATRYQPELGRRALTEREGNFTLTRHRGSVRWLGESRYGIPNTETVRAIQSCSFARNLRLKNDIPRCQGLLVILATEMLCTRGTG